MVLLEQLRTVLAFAEEDLLAAWVHLSILCHVIHTALVDRPAVILLIVNFYFLRS